MKTQSIIDYLEVYDGKTEDIKELVINRFDIVGEIQSVDLEDLKHFPNLEKITFIGLVFEDFEYDALNKLNKLKCLNLINCDLLYIGDIFNNITDLVLDNTSISKEVFNKHYDYLEIRHMEINDTKLDASTLVINQGDIDFNLLDCKNLENLTVSVKQFKNNKNFINSLNVDLIIKDEYDKVVNYENL